MLSAREKHLCPSQNGSRKSWETIVQEHYIVCERRNDTPVRAVSHADDPGGWNMRKGTLLKSALLAVTIAASAFAATPSADASQRGVRVGTLTCSVASGWGHVVASRRDMNCAYHRNRHGTEHYVGEIR